MRLSDATVLLVDDEPLLLEMTSHWFEREQCRLVKAENGVKALQALSSKNVDLIVTDIRMPELDGIGLLRKVKARGCYTPSIVFISSTSDVTRRDAGNLGIEATFSKPVLRQQLVATANRVLMEKETIWRSPWHGENGPDLSLTFRSLSLALEHGQIAFGKGGFCVESKMVFDEGPVRFDISFTADGRTLSGHGHVRWSAPDESRLGVEIGCLEEKSHWVIQHTSENATRSYIPAVITSIAQVPATQAVGGVSHEIGNLLSVIDGYSQACQELLKPDDPAWRYVEQIRACTERAGILNRRTMDSVVIKSPIEKAKTK